MYILSIEPFNYKIERLYLTIKFNIPLLLVHSVKGVHNRLNIITLN